MAAGLPPEARRRRERLLRGARHAEGVSVLFDEASRRLRDLVPHDASAWLTTDPVTGFPTAPSRVEGVEASPELCSAHWRHELMDDDVNRFSDLTRARRPASALRLTAGDPRRSGRFRTFLRPHGFGDELRAVLRVGVTPWATVTLWRREGQPPFSPSDTGLLASLSAPLGEAMRGLARAHLAPRSDGSFAPPGLLVFDEAGRLASANEHARGWLDELTPEDKVATALGLDLPIWLLLVVNRAKESLAGDEGGSAAIRVRSRRGRWLLCRASTTLASDGSTAGTVVHIEPAGPGTLTPIVNETYGLTDRESEVIAQIARGVPTGEIARALCLSPHTVKDHVKAILRKVGVTSRGELVATLYAGHYQRAHLEEVNRPSAS